MDSKNRTRRTPAKKKKPSTFKPARAFVIGLFLFVGVVFINLLNNENLGEISEMQQRIDVMDDRIAELGRENEQLRTKIISIGKDDHLIEKVAREELGLVKSGEIVYKMYD